jgi:hypothetical protein
VDGIGFFPNFVRIDGLTGDVVWTQVLKQKIIMPTYCHKCNGILLAGTFSGVITLGNMSVAAPNGQGAIFFARMDLDGTVHAMSRLNTTVTPSLSGISLDSQGSLYMLGDLQSGNITINGATSGQSSTSTFISRSSLVR